MYYRELDAQFDLVMILERFDESLVLLQDLMCWPTEDIVYLKQNERTAKESTFDGLKKHFLDNHQLLFGLQFEMTTYAHRRPRRT